MSDLKDILPQDSQTVQAIYDHWKQKGENEEGRGYLGGSSIGEECERKLWYSFRQCSKPEFDGRFYRLFNRGHREEPVFVDELKAIGCQVHEVGPDGKQFQVVAFGGHFKGHADGVALGIPEAPKTWHLLEMKTSNTKNFKKVKELGCEKYNPIHFAQMQVYMQLMNLDRALYIVVCKETDELYSERIKRDPTKAQSLLTKAERIIFNSQPPERISDRADAWACKFCDAKTLCHGLGDDAVPLPSLSCRQCCHATPECDGSWSCKAGKVYGIPCEKHLMLPGLVNFAEPTDAPADGSSIEYTSKDGTVWNHGSDENAGQFSSKHLMTMPRDLIELPSVPSVKQGGRIVPNLEARYALSTQGIESVWRGETSQLEREWAKRIKQPMKNPTSTQIGESWQAAEFGNACVIIFADGQIAEIRIDTNQ